MAENVLIERGQISDVSQDHIHVICQSKIDCARCAQGRGCGGGILARWLGDRQYRLKIPYSSERFQPNLQQIAEFSLPANVIVRIAAIIYGLPLLCTAAALTLIYQKTSEINAIFVALLSLFMGFILARKLVNILIGKGFLQPQLLSIKQVDAPSSCALENVSRSRQGGNEYV